MSKISAIIQARFSSKRFPAKILKELPFGSEITVLGQVIRRLKKSKILNDIIIATTTDQTNNEIIGIAKKENVRWFKGSEENVLLRYYLAARENKVDIIVRVTSDCPCIDSNIVDLVIDRHVKSKADYTAPSKTKPYPAGLDVEVFNFSSLEIVNRQASCDFEKEHVTPYFYMNPKRFKIAEFELDAYLRVSDIRITLDTQEDYALLCAVFDYLYYNDSNFTAYDIVNLFKEKPWLKLINKKIAQKKILTSLEDELKEAAAILELQDLKRARDFIKHRLNNRIFYGA